MSAPSQLVKLTHFLCFVTFPSSCKHGSLFFYLHFSVVIRVHPCTSVVSLPFCDLCAFSRLNSGSSVPLPRVRIRVNSCPLVVSVFGGGSTARVRSFSFSPLYQQTSPARLDSCPCSTRRDRKRRKSYYPSVSLRLPCNVCSKRLKSSARRSASFFRDPC